MSKLNKYQGTSILSQNAKMKKTSKENNVNLYNFGIPAYKTASGKMTCPFAKDCVKFCYAQKGAYSWSNVKPAFEKRYELTKDENFVSIMSDAIKGTKATHIRIHDSGDFYSMDYIFNWFTIAVNNPNVTFYFYTKSISLFKGLELPKNMFSIYSYGSKNDSLINKAIDRHAVIFNSYEELNEAGYTDCSNNDLAIMKTKKVGLILH
jgi:hypothetical protein